MNTHVRKAQRFKGRTILNRSAQERSGGEAAFQYIDNRREIIAQRKPQGMAHTGLQEKQPGILSRTSGNTLQPTQLWPLTKQEPAIQLKKERKGREYSVQQQDMLDAASGKFPGDGFNESHLSRKFGPIPKAAGTVQRYVRISKDAEADTSATTAGKSFTVDQKVEDLFTSQVTEEGEETADKYNAISQKGGAAGVALNVADTGELAVEDVGQPKNYFATTDKIEESNKRLSAAHSAYKMIQKEQSITISLGDDELTLYKVYPENRLTRTKDLAATSLHRCNEMATRVMGIHYHESPLTRYRESPSTRPLGPEKRDADQKSAMKEKVLQSLFSDAEFVKEYAELSLIQRKELAKDTGINQFAASDGDIGMALQTRSTGDYGAQGKWNYHWAGIVAKSGDDFVTLENYNRADETQGYLPVAGEDVDTRWFFQIYGKEAGNTFHDKMVAADDYLNPITTLHFKSHEKQNEQDLEKGTEVLSEEQVSAFLRKTLGFRDPAADRAALMAMLEADRRRERMRYVKIGGAVIALSLFIGGLLSEFYGYTNITGLGPGKRLH